MDTFFFPKKESLSEVHKMMHAQKETARLDFLSNPNQQFSYKIRADGTCLVDQPFDVLAKDLRAAIDYCIEKQSKNKPH